MDMYLFSQISENKSLGFLEHWKMPDFSFYFTSFLPFHFNKYTYHLAQQRKLDFLLMLKSIWQDLGVVIEEMRLLPMLSVKKILSNESYSNGHY